MPFSLIVIFMTERRHIGKTNKFVNEKFIF